MSLKSVGSRQGRPQGDLHSPALCPDTVLLAFRIILCWKRSPAPADNAFGGGGRHGYLPLFISRGRPLGARLVSGALENPGMNYAGVQFSDDEQFCLGGEGEDIGQDVNIRVDLLVPGDNGGNITQAGPYFRTRSATPGSSIFGGTSAGLLGATA